MASEAFTATVTPSQIYRGRASVGMKPYGSGSMATLGALREDVNVQINVLGEFTKEYVHDLPGAYKAHIINGEIEVLFMMAERTAAFIARLLGKTTTDVDDNSGNTPPDMRVQFGDTYGLNEWTFQVQTPQTEAASPLYDLIIIPKGVFDPTAFKQEFGKKVTPHGIAARFQSLCDTTHATYPNAHGIWVKEYSA